MRYSLLRLVLLIGCAALLYWVGLRGALLWLAAIVFAFLLAFILFPRTGDAAAAQLKRTVNRTGTTADTHEDEILDGAETADAEEAASSADAEEAAESAEDGASADR